MAVEKDSSPMYDPLSQNFSDANICHRIFPRGNVSVELKQNSKIQYHQKQDEESTTTSYPRSFKNISNIKGLQCL
jgi:hypothetical protein